MLFRGFSVFGVFGVFGILIVFIIRFSVFSIFFTLRFIFKPSFILLTNLRTVFLVLLGSFVSGLTLEIFFIFLLSLIIDFGNVFNLFSAKSIYSRFLRRPISSGKEVKLFLDK